MPKSYDIRSDADLRKIDAYMKRGKKKSQKKATAKFMVDGTSDTSTHHLLCLVAEECIVKEVSVVNTFTRPFDSCKFLRALMNNKDAKSIVLDFSGNAVDERCINILQKLIKENTVHKLTLSCLDAVNVKDILVSVLDRKSHMKSLAIPNSTLNDECINSFATILSTRKVKHLCLSGCKPPEGSTVEQQKRRLTGSIKSKIWKSGTSFTWEAGEATEKAGEEKKGYNSTNSLYPDFATPQLSRSVSTLKLSKGSHLPRRDKAGAVSKLPKKGHHGSVNFSPQVRRQWTKSLASINDEGHFLSNSRSFLNSPMSSRHRGLSKSSESLLLEDFPTPESEPENAWHSLHGQANIQQKLITKANSSTATSEKTSDAVKDLHFSCLQNVQESDTSTTEAGAKERPCSLSAVQMESFSGEGIVDQDTFETHSGSELDLPDSTKLFSNSATTETETDLIKSALTSQRTEPPVDSSETMAPSSIPLSSYFEIFEKAVDEFVKISGRSQNATKVSSSSSVDPECSKFNQQDVDKDSNSSSVDPEPAKSHIPRFGRTGMVASRVRQYEVTNYFTYFHARRKRFSSSNQAEYYSDLKSSSLNPFPVLKENEENVGKAAVSMLEIRKDDEKHLIKPSCLVPSESLGAIEESKDEDPRKSVKDLKEFHEKEIEKQSSNENVASFYVERDDVLKSPPTIERPKTIVESAAANKGNSPSTSHGVNVVAQENFCTAFLAGPETSNPAPNSSENADLVVLPQSAAGSFSSLLSESDDGNPISESFSVDIEPNGGGFMFYDCVIDIPRLCFTESTKLKGKLEIAPNKCPKGYIPITPMLYLESSNPPLKPITVRMTSWCINDGSEEGKGVKVDVLHLPTGADDWEVIATLPFLDETKFQFDTPTKFSPFLVALRELFFGPQEFLIEGFLFSDRDDNFKFLFHLQHSLIDHVLGRRNYSNINDEKRICFDTLSVKANDTIRAEISSENLNFANAGASEFAVDEHFIRRQKWWRFETRILNNIPDTMELRCATFLNNTIKNRYSHTYSAKKGELQSIVTEVVATDNAVVVVEKNLGSGESAALILIVLSIFVLVVGILIKHFFSY